MLCFVSTDVEISLFFFFFCPYLVSLFSLLHLSFPICSLNVGQCFRSINAFWGKLKVALLELYPVSNKTTLFLARKSVGGLGRCRPIERIKGDWISRTCSTLNKNGEFILKTKIWFFNGNLPSARTPHSQVHLFQYQYLVLLNLQASACLCHDDLHTECGVFFWAFTLWIHVQRILRGLFQLSSLNNRGLLGPNQDDKHYSFRFRQILHHWFPNWEPASFLHRITQRSKNCIDCRDSGHLY